MEANISGLKAPIGKSKTSFENYMLFLAFIWAQEQVNSIPASLRKSGFKKITWTKTEPIVNMVHVSFLKPNFLSDARVELTYSFAQMKAKNM